MRRNSRMKTNTNKQLTDKILIYASIAVALISLILIGAFLYSRSLNNNAKQGTMTLEQMANIANNVANEQKEEAESASTQMGKTVEESSKEEENITEETSNTTESESENTTNATSTANTTNEKTTANNNSQNETQEVKKELSFTMPVEGEIVKQYVKDSLVYSATLEEWVTHLGIDIEAEKTTVVKSAEEGKVKSIKNDPRYGLTIVIEHEDGYQTIYANLLSSEFVVEGEKVTKGQTIGTVGNTAAFESVDNPHLHFELLKDGVQVDPSIYLK